MKIVPCALLGILALAPLAGRAEEAPSAGVFRGPASPAPAFSGSVAQNRAPDNSALSLLFQEFRIAQQGDGKRQDSLHYALQAPLALPRAGRIKVELRGAVVADKGVQCTVSMDTPDGPAVVRANRSRQVYLSKFVALTPEDAELSVLIQLRCSGKAGSKPAFMAEVDSVELSWTPARKP